MKTRKKASAGMFLFGFSILAAVVSFIIAVISCVDISMSQLTSVGVLTAVGIACSLAAMYVSSVKGDGLISTVLILLTVAALSLTVYQMVMGKSDVFGVVIFSDLEKGYAPSENAAWRGVAAIIGYLVSALAAAVGSFTDLSAGK